jgi:hypothetical protein
MAALAAALAAGLLLVVAVAPAEADTDSADGEQLCAFAPPHDSGIVGFLGCRGLFVLFLLERD